MKWKKYYLVWKSHLNSQIKKSNRIMVFTWRNFYAIKVSTKIVSLLGREDIFDVIKSRYIITEMCGKVIDITFIFWAIDFQEFSVQRICRQLNWNYREFNEQWTSFWFFQVSRDLTESQSSFNVIINPKIVTKFVIFEWFLIVIFQ